MVQRSWCLNEELELSSSSVRRFLRSCPRTFPGIPWHVDGDSGSNTGTPWHMVRTDFAGKSKCGSGVLDTSQRRGSDSSGRDVVGAENRAGLAGHVDCSTDEGAVAFGGLDRCGGESDCQIPRADAEKHGDEGSRWFVAKRQLPRGLVA